MTKQERAIKAQVHYEDIKTRLAANTKLSIERTYTNQLLLQCIMVEQQFLTMPVIKVLAVQSRAKGSRYYNLRSTQFPESPGKLAMIQRSEDLVH